MTIEDDLMRQTVRIFGLACFFGGAAATLFAVFYLHKMRVHVRSEHRMLVLFLGPFMLLMPKLFDDVGNRARTRFIIAALLFAAFFAGAKLSIEALRG